MIRKVDVDFFFFQNPDLDKRHLRTQELLYLRLTWQVQIL